jgi:hypothetical protein
MTLPYFCIFLPLNYIKLNEIIFYESDGYSASKWDIGFNKVVANSILSSGVSILRKVNQTEISSLKALIVKLGGLSVVELMFSHEDFDRCFEYTIEESIWNLEKYVFKDYAWQLES